MIVTLSGITGTGKSFFKDAIAKELGFKNLVIVTTRKKRTGEIAGIDKEFVSNEEFEEKVKTSEITANFEFLGAKYGYRKELLESDENLVTEVHYNRIYDIKRHARNIFSIYIIPYDVKRAKKELRKARGMTQKELAKKTSLSIASIQGYEQKKYKPKLNTIAKIAVALDVLLLDLVDTDDPILQNEITAINIPDLNYINSVLRSTRSQNIYELNRILSDKNDIQQLFWDLLTNFNLLNEFGKKEAVKQIELFSKIPDYRKEDDKQE